MNVTDRRERLRAVLGGEECLHPASVFDPISARVAEDLGFEVGFLSGSTCEATVLGAPDLHLVVLTLSELAHQVRRICRASGISLMVDADHGYGNALSVMRTVEELENAGASALMVEDSVMPMAFGSGAGEKQTTSLEEGVGKMKAALDSRQDSSLVIVGRTRASQTGGISEGIRRAKAYEKVGVDALFLSGSMTREGIAALHAETRLPFVMSDTALELGDRRFLAANGVRIVHQGHVALMASVKAVHDALKGLRGGKSPADLRPLLAPPELMAQVTRQAQYNEWIKSYLN